MRDGVDSAGVNRAKEPGRSPREGLLTPGCPRSTIGGRHVQTPPKEPPVADTAPAGEVLTGYDEQHLVTYLRLLDAAAEDADWREVAQLVLRIDPGREPERAERAWESHLNRARWMTTSGYRHLLQDGAPH